MPANGRWGLIRGLKGYIWKISFSTNAEISKITFLILLTSLERGVDKYGNHIWGEETQLLIF